MSGVTKELLDRELASRGKTGLAEKFGLSVGHFNTLIKVMEMKDDKDDPDGFDRIVASALRQSVLQFERIEKLEDDLKQANNIIRYNDDEVARLSACELDASRYRVLRASDARAAEELDAYCDKLISESEPPKGGGSEHG